MFPITIDLINNIPYEPGFYRVHAVMQERDTMKSPYLDGYRQGYRFMGRERQKVL